jgi:hypothetical protein
VIALTPPLLWLQLRVSGRRATALRLVAVGGCAAVAIGIISTLDWLRGPGQRSHLGDFVQRIVDGDAAQVVIRKGLASADTILSPGGLASLLIGGVLWLLIFRLVLPVLIPTFPTLRLVAWAVLATAALGTLLNDGGISVLIAASGSFAFTVASLWVDRAEAEGQLSWAGSAHR